MLKLIKTIAMLLFVQVSFAQSPLLTLMVDDGITYEAETTAFIARVEADGGEVLDPDGLNDFIVLLKAQGVYDNLVFLVDPNWGVKKNTNNKITVLYDLLGNDLTEADTSKVPTLTDYVDNGSGATTLKDALFDGSNDYITTTTLSVAQPLSTFLVYRPLRHTLYDTFVATTSAPWQQWYEANTANKLYINSYLATADMETLNNMGLLRVMLSGASSEVQYNDNSEETGNMGTDGFTGFAMTGFLGSNCVKMELGLASMFDDNISALAVSAIQSFLITRWNL